MISCVLMSMRISFTTTRTTTTTTKMRTPSDQTGRLKSNCRVWRMNYRGRQNLSYPWWNWSTNKQGTSKLTVESSSLHQKPRWPRRSKPTLPTTPLPPLAQPNADLPAIVAVNFCQRSEASIVKWRGALENGISFATEQECQGENNSTTRASHIEISKL